MDAARAMVADVGCGMADVGGGGASAAPMLRLIGGDDPHPKAAPVVGGSGKRARRRAGGGGVRADEGAKVGGEREWNAAVYLTSYPVPGGRSCLGGNVSEFAAFSETRATKDKADRAHRVRGDAGLLVCAADLSPTMSRPRRYPAHQMTSRGVSFDSAFDELHRRQTSLGEMGISDIGGNWARRSVGSVSGITLERAAAEAAARGKSLREMTRQRLNEPSMGDSEESAEAYAKRQIAMFKAGTWAPSDGGAK